MRWIAMLTLLLFAGCNVTPRVSVNVSTTVDDVDVSARIDL